MNQLKIRPIHFLLIVFALHCFLVVGMGWFAYSFHGRASELTSGQPEMVSKAAAARVRIEAEQDISKLREWALVSHDRSAKDWDLVVSNFNDTDTAIRGLYPLYVLTAALVGLAIFGLRRSSGNA